MCADSDKQSRQEKLGGKEPENLKRKKGSDRQVTPIPPKAPNLVEREGRFTNTHKPGESTRAGEHKKGNLYDVKDVGAKGHKKTMIGNTGSRKSK